MSYSVYNSRRIALRAASATRSSELSSARTTAGKPTGPNSTSWSTIRSGSRQGGVRSLCSSDAARVASQDSGSRVRTAAQTNAKPTHARKSTTPRRVVRAAGGRALRCLAYSAAIHAFRIDSRSYLFDYSAPGSHDGLRDPISAQRARRLSDSLVWACMGGRRIIPSR